MKQKIADIMTALEAEKVNTTEELEHFRIRYIGKKGLVPALFEEFKQLPPEEKKDIGQLVNALKNHAQNLYQVLKENLDSKTASTDKDLIDFTRPVDYKPMGSYHPLTLTLNQITAIFTRLGYVISEGPEIEDDWHNFSALNFPPDHPAREMQDTFFISMDPDIALRTHTSSVQVRVMKTEKPPIRTISPGRVFRNEAISARAHCIFHQVEGLYINQNVSFADLKHDLFFFAREMFGEETQIRLRPSYFPFTEPSAEMDVSCNICKGKGCNICKYTGWLEIMGCGMVDPQVLLNCQIDPEKFSGFAFGMGVERIAMLKYQIKDIRLFFENDMRFLQQFG